MLTLQQLKALRKFKTGQKVIIVKKPNRATNIEIGDLAIECGKHQFHSVDLVDIGIKRENYWVITA